MAINYTVVAQVVDLRYDKSKASDRWLVDTNVLFWSAYSNASYATSGPKGYQLNDYQAYLKKVTQAGGALFWCGLSLAEMAHRIECAEFDIAKSYGATTATNAKEYRHNDRKQWQHVVGEIEAAWDIVKSLGQPLAPGIVIDEATTKQAITDMPGCGVGGYDIFLVQTLRAGDLTGIITDDGDFCTAPGIMVCTANQTVIKAAAAQAKITKR